MCDSVGHNLAHIWAYLEQRYPRSLKIASLTSAADAIQLIKLCSLQVRTYTKYLMHLSSWETTAES